MMSHEKKKGGGTKKTPDEAGGGYSIRVGTTLCFWKGQTP